MMDFEYDFNELPEKNHHERFSDPLDDNFLDYYGGYFFHGENNTLKIDRYDYKEYKDLTNRSQPLKELADLNGGSEICSDLMTDIFSGLHKHASTKDLLKDDADIKASRIVNKAIIEEISNLTEWESFRKYTINNVIASGIAMLDIGAKAKECLKKYKDEVMRLKDLEHSIQLQRDIIENKKQNNKSTRKNNKKLSKLQNNLQKYTKQLQSNIDKDRINMRIAMRNALKEAEEKSDMIDTLSYGYSNDQDVISSMNIEEAIKLSKLLTNDKMRAIIRMAGRLQNIASHKRRTRSTTIPEEVFDINLGNEISRLLPSELILLRRSKKIFYKKLVEGEMLQYVLRGTEKTGKGPMIICEDQSGSMMNEREIWAKAFFLALITIAKKEKRDIAYIPFGNNVNCHYYFPKSKVSMNDIIKIISSFLGHMGTNFNEPLNCSLNYLKNKIPKADIIFITDGESVVDDKVETDIIHYKNTKGLHFYTVLVQSGDTDGLKNLTDEVIRIEENFDVANDLFNKI